MRWRRRRPIDPPPATMPRLDRERVALARLSTATDDAALAQWARLRLRASDFVAAHAAPTPAAIKAAAARDAVGEPLLTPPSPLPRAVGATLVDVTAKLPTLDRLAAINAPRHDGEADARLARAHARSNRIAEDVAIHWADEVAREVARINRRAIRRVAGAVAVIVLLLFASVRAEHHATAEMKEAIRWAWLTAAFLAIAPAMRFVRWRRIASRQAADDRGDGGVVPGPPQG